MKGPELLKHYEDNWQTDMGAWFPGERVVLRGKDVFTELNNHTWMEYLVYAATGNESPKLARLYEGIWTLSSSFPDPRLWNNRVAALAGTAKSTGALAISAGIAVSEATIYGFRPGQGALDFLHRAQGQKQNGIPIQDIVTQELKKYRSVFGYGRPVVNQDERIQPFLAFLRQMDIEPGIYSKLALEVEEYLKQSRLKYQMNIAGLVAGVLADQGVMPEEEYYCVILSFVAGIMPCYIDAKNKSEGTYYPLSVGRIKYSGICHDKKWAC